MLYIPEAASFFVIGGWDGQSVISQIAKLKDGKWYDAGQLNTARRVNLFYLNLFSKDDFKDHSAQWFNSVVVVAGGTETQPTESCKVNDDTGKFECQVISPTLTSYENGVSFLVQSDYCVLIN